MSEESPSGRSGGSLPSSVEEYLARLPADVQAVLQGLRSAIRAAAPQASEVISYQIPSYKLSGALVHFAAFENHCSFYVVDKSILSQFSSELKDYRTSGTTIHFSVENPLPEELVERIVMVRVEQNERRARSKHS
jgi:uncharacterized protein YdhG (YjbR/CyaY superfamily)